MNIARSTIYSQKLYLIIVALTLIGCSTSDDGRVTASGIVSVNGLPVQTGTLVLIPKSGNQPSVATRISAGQFAFGKLTGPRPGEYIAKVNQDESSIEEIAEMAATNPREAVKQFSADETSSPLANETIVTIKDVPGQIVSIELN